MSPAFLPPTPLLARRSLSPLAAISPRRHLSPAQLVRTTLTPATSPVSMAADKMLHAVYRVGDLPATRRFLDALGMRVLRERDIPAEKYTNVFYGFGSERRGEHFSLELTYNYGVSTYDLGTAFGHFSVAVPDLSTALQRVRAAGFAPDDATTCLPNGTRTAFVADPLGFRFQLVERVQRDPLCSLMLRVTDLQRSVAFYETLGMTVLRTVTAGPDLPASAVMSFADEENATTTLELTVDPAIPQLAPGDAYAQIAVSTPDVYAAAKRFEDKGIPLARAPGPVPGIGTKICAVRDPDGWKTVLVDAEDFEKEFE